jgi:hypothetical protein
MGRRQMKRGPPRPNLNRLDAISWRRPATRERWPQPSKKDEAARSQTNAVPTAILSVFYLTPFWIVFSKIFNGMN